jgi:hypothetical protein
MALSPGLFSIWCGREDSCPKTEARSAEGRAPEDHLTQQPSVARMVRKGGLVPEDRGPQRRRSSA